MIICFLIELFDRYSNISKYVISLVVIRLLIFNFKISTLIQGHEISNYKIARFRISYIIFFRSAHLSLRISSNDDAPLPEITGVRSNIL